MGPGVYNQGKNFGQDVKPMYIKTKPKEKKVNPTPAPGQYNPDKAEALTKPRPKSAFLPTSKRPS